MKRIGLWIFVVLFCFGIGIYFKGFVSAYFRYSELQNEVYFMPPQEIGDGYHFSGRTWQDKEHPCGKPNKSIFDDGRYIITDNPLCNYSFDLHEISTVDYDELARFPEFYNRKIVRVRGQLYMNPKAEYPHESRLYMMSDLLNVEKPIEFHSPIRFDVMETARKFIEVNSPETNRAEVSLIIWFLDISKDPTRLEFKNNNPLQMLILYVEDMKSILPENKKGMKTRVLKQRGNAS